MATVAKLMAVLVNVTNPSRVVVRGRLVDEVEALYVRAAWDEAEGFSVAIDAVGYEIVWPSLPSGTTWPEAVDTMTAALERHLTAARFLADRRCYIGYRETELDGQVWTSHYRMYGVKVDHQPMTIDLAAYRSAAEAMKTSLGLSLAMLVFFSADRLAPFPRARWYWALEELRAEVGGGRKLEQKIGWGHKRMSHLTQALQHHRHPNQPEVMNDEACRSETYEAIVAYARQLGFSLSP